MPRRGHIQLVLREGGARPHVPNYLDYLLGANRPASTLGVERVDRALQRWSGGCRVLGAYHARRSLGKVGEQNVAFNDTEEELALSRTYRVELAYGERTSDVLAALRDLSDVEAAGRESFAVATVARAPERGPARLARDELWAPYHQVHALEALEREPGSAQTSVAVVDTGVSLWHPELSGRIMAGYDTVNIGMGQIGADLFLVGDSRGPDFLASDCTGHGSHVAGIIGARGLRMARGVAGYSLVLPMRALAAARIRGHAGNKLLGIGGLFDIDLGLKLAVDMGADVINMSFGTVQSDVDPEGPLPHRAVVQYAERCGCVLVAAAGNLGTTEVHYPAAHPEVIAVGSVNGHGRRSGFSSYGAHVTLTAPGENVLSLGMSGYAVSTGTSQSAPFVSATAALLLSRARRAGRALRPGEVRALLAHSAAPLGPGGFSPETGYGLLDAAAALRQLDRELGRDGRTPARR